MHKVFLKNEQVVSLQSSKRKRTDWCDFLIRWRLPILLTLIVMIGVTVLFIEDFLLKAMGVALCFVFITNWLTQNRSRFPRITILFSKTSERITWIFYSIFCVIFVTDPAFATGTGGVRGASGSCAATNTILGPIADALMGVFNSTTQIGSTGTVSDNICQVFTTFAAIIVLLIIGSTIWGLFDNQGRGTDIGKAFSPLGLVLAGVVVVRISIKLVMGA